MFFSQTDRNVNFIDTIDEDLFFSFQITQIFESSSKTDLQIKKKSVRCYLFHENVKQKFLNWGNTTKGFTSDTKKSETIQKIDKKSKHLYGNADKKTACGEHFDEKISIDDDTPKIICRRCNLILEHFSLKHDINTASVHLENRKCMKISKTHSFSQLTLKKTGSKIKAFLLQTISTKISTFFSVK